MDLPGAIWVFRVALSEAYVGVEDGMLVISPGSATMPIHHGAEVVWTATGPGRVGAGVVMMSRQAAVALCAA
jgi:hypothetical protein